MEIKAAEGIILYGTAQGIVLVLLRGTDDVCRKINLRLVRVLGLKIILLSSAAAAQRGVLTMIAKKGPYLYLISQYCI